MTGTEKMRELITRFPNQLREALELDLSGLAAVDAGLNTPVKQVVFCGMGGSGIGGALAREWLAGEEPVPIIVNEDYTLPSFARDDSLVVVSSYSGNTEEALEMFRQVQGSSIVCITSGGKLGQIARDRMLPLVKLPTGLPPRAALAYSAVAHMAVLNRIGLTSDAYRQDVLKAAALLEREQEDIMKLASVVADGCAWKVTAIYAGSELETVALRFRQQLEENAKQLAWHHVLPEMNHNEVNGWQYFHSEVAGIFLRWDYEHPRTGLQLSFTQELIEKHAGFYGEIRAKGESRIAQSLYLIHVSDWVSQLIGEGRGIDTMEVKVINDLKEYLGKR